MDKIDFQIQVHCCWELFFFLFFQKDWAKELIDDISYSDCIRFEILSNIYLRSKQFSRYITLFIRGMNRVEYTSGR